MTQTIVNLGTGGPALNGQNGSTGGADSNDALFLDWTGLNYVYLPGVGGNFLSVPDEAALDITGDIDIRVQVALDDWTPVANSALVSKFASGAISYEFSLNTTGALSLVWTADGTTQISLASTATVAATDGDALWLRAVLDVNDGGVYKVYFYTSTDGSAWTQLGATIAGGAVTSIFSSSTAVNIGRRSEGGLILAAKVYRAQVLNGIDGTKVLDVDTGVISTGAAASFAAITGQTVTINRSTSGRKSVSVVAPVWLFGTDDFMQVADNDLLDFGASDSFTVLAVVRQWATPASFGKYMSKRTTGTAVGWDMQTDGINFRNYANIDDGPNLTPYNPRSFTANVLTLLGMTIDRSTGTQTTIANELTTTADVSAVGSISNSQLLRIGGASSGGSLQDFELLAVAVFRRALTTTEITAVSTYYQNKAA